MDTKHIILFIAVAYSAIWLIFGLVTGATLGRGGKIRRETDPKAYWSQLAWRSVPGIGAIILMIAER